MTFLLKRVIDQICVKHKIP